MIEAILRRVGLVWLTPSGLCWLDEWRIRSVARWPVLPVHRCDLVWAVPTWPRPVDPEIELTPPY